MLKTEGIYRVSVSSWTLKQFGSGSTAIKMKLDVLNHYDATAEAWSARYPEGYDVQMDTFVIGKDNNLLERGVKDLTSIDLWDGNFESLAGDPPEINFIVKVSQNDKGFFEANWPQADTDGAPKMGGGGKAFEPADPDLLRQMSSRFGPALKAIGGGQTAGAPPAPPAAPPAPPAPNVGNRAPATQAEIDSEDNPFDNPPTP